jgi:hypothetical protein
MEEGEKEMNSRIKAIFGHKYSYLYPEKKGPAKKKYIEFTVLWEKQFSYVNYKKFNFYNMVAQYVRRTNDPELTERYRELKSARTLFAIYEDNKTVKWCLNNGKSVLKL